MDDIDLYDKVALVTADQNCCGRIFKMNCENDDCVSYYYWAEILRAPHFSYSYFRNDDYSELTNFSAVILQGEPCCWTTVLKMAPQLKGKTVMMFLPELVVGDKSINDFHREERDVWSVVDVIMPWEENTESYYTSLVDTPAVFVYVPIRESMANGDFFVPVESKSDAFVIYGDNNPTNPLIAIGVARRLKKPVIIVMVVKEKVEVIKKLFNVEVLNNFYRMGTYPYLRLLGHSRVHVYPNSRLGSNREIVSCACVGTPCIGNMMSHTQKRLFPKLACDYRNIDSIVTLVERLYNDLDFYKEIVQYARDNVQFYNIENSIKRFIKAYTEGKKKAGIV